VPLPVLAMVKPCESCAPHVPAKAANAAGGTEVGVGTEAAVEGGADPVGPGAVTADLGLLEMVDRVAVVGEVWACALPTR
jgi:hypothetical protein